MYVGANVQPVCTNTSVQIAFLHLPETESPPLKNG